MIVIGDLHSILLINELQGTIRHSCVILDKDHGYVGCVRIIGICQRLGYSRCWGVIKSTRFGFLTNDIQPSLYTSMY